MIALSEGDVEAARGWFLASAKLMREVRDPDGTLQLLDGFAGVAVSLGRPEVAARLIGAARRLRDTSGAAMPLVRPFLDRLERETLDALERPELRQALAVGAASSAQDALEFARGALAVPA